MPCKISFILISCYIKTVPAYRHFCSYRRNCFYFYMILLRQSSLTLLPTETYQSSFSAVPLLPAPAVRAVPASVFLMFWYFLKQGYRNPTGFRRWVKVVGSGGLCYTCVMGMWKSKNRHKYLLQYHIIFECRYRKKLLMSKQISDDIKQFSYEICQKHKVIIRYMETDKGERCPVDICYDPTEMECRPIFIT